MCEIEMTPGKEDGDISIRCKISGKPITGSDDWGMHCENKCGHGSESEAHEIMEEFFKFFDN